MVGKELGGDDRDERREPLGHGRELDEVAELAERGNVRQHEQTRPSLLQPAEQLGHSLQGRAGGGDRENREALGDQRDRAVLEVCGGIRVRQDVRQLLELQGPFPSRGVMEPAGENGAPVLPGPGIRDAGHLRLLLERRFERSRNGPQLILRLPIARQGGRDHGDDGYLREVRLGRGDRAFLARFELDEVLRRDGQLRHRVVRDGDRQRALAARFREHGHHVRRAARLRDSDDERVAQPRRRSV